MHDPHVAARTAIVEEAVDGMREDVVVRIGREVPEVLAVFGEVGAQLDLMLLLAIDPS